jgi:serine O-acetyltransferase
MTAMTETLGSVRPSLVPDAPPTGDTNQNPAGIRFWELVAEDVRTYDNQWDQPGLWAVLVHRYGNWRMDIRPRALRMPFSLVYKVAQKFVLWFWGIQLEYTVKLGRRVRIWHHGGMVFGAAEIGNDVHLRQNTTFGSARLDERFAKPSIGDGVDVGCGAVVLGRVRVGHDSAIGANAVVVRDVPPYCVVGGVPARILKRLRPADEHEAAPSSDSSRHTG